MILETKLQQDYHAANTSIRGLRHLKNRSKRIARSQVKELFLYKRHTARQRYTPIRLAVEPFEQTQLLIIIFLLF